MRLEISLVSAFQADPVMRQKTMIFPSSATNGLYWPCARDEFNDAFSNWRPQFSFPFCPEARGGVLRLFFRLDSF